MAADANVLAGFRRRLGPWVCDLAVLAPLVVVLPVFAGSDGGSGLYAAITLGIAALVALPGVVTEVRRLPRLALVLLGMWLLGLVLGVVASRYRAAMTVPLLQYSVAPVLVLSARRLWRRSWGPAAVVVLLTVAFARYQLDSWLTWWGQTESGMGLWRPLSWRNQSAALTGMFGVWFLGLSLCSTRILRMGFGLLAASAFAGTWLSSSRAGLAVSLVATVIAMAIGIRSERLQGRPLWKPLATAVVVLLVGALMVTGLLSMQPAGTSQALEAREQGVGQNLSARLHHTGAALGMFADRPLTGQGLGSYKALARQWNDPAGNLTASAHNEYAEVAGEMGVFGGGALLGVLLSVSVLGIRVLRRPPRSPRGSDLRGPLVVGGVAAAALFFAHSALDFDWNYPVLIAMAAIAFALMLPDRPRRELPRLAVGATVGTLAALLVAGLAFGLIETRGQTPPPWDEGARVAAGFAALEDGDPSSAREAASAVLRWNPGSPSARSLAAIAQFHLDGNVEALRTALAAQRHALVDRARGALAVAEAGHEDVAMSMLEDLDADLGHYRAWGTATARLLAREADVVATAARSCADAQHVVAEALRDDDSDQRPLPDLASEILSARLRMEGC